MASKDEQALVMVMTVLHTPEIFDLKPFSILRARFDPVELAGLIGDFGLHINVKFESAPKGTRDGAAVAFYDSVEDALFVNFTDAFSISLQGLVIHEAVHALCDKNKAKMDIGTSESMAYIVQCHFQMLRAGWGAPRPGAGARDGKDPWDVVFAQGTEIAERLESGFETGELSAFSYQPMRKAVNLHPNYKDKISQPAIYNGFKRRTK
ncbi:MAG: hypothetical protein FJX20_00365 [Alphaproteobacteria bacterium]|nr:hypothetical protein [Alphaproteobacteria bacterium]